ncbi:MAG: YkgJ family cysteine cluster protein [Phycisphaerae bacterium]|nr:YkgJ family cysteine cluster protein [Phycisphaerae bacterium]
MTRDDAKSAVSLPLVVLPLAEQRYSCHGCGNCCRDFTVQLRPADRAKLAKQDWETKLGEPVTMEFRGQLYLRQREDGACVFLMEGGKCRIHAEYGLQAKPLACQLFPFVFAPGQERTTVGLSFACQSVLRNKGAALPSHLREVRTLAEQVPELVSSRTLLVRGIAAEPEEVQAFSEAVDRWLRNTETPMAVRLDGLAWLSQQLARANFAKVRRERLTELMDILVTALPDELPLHPIAPPTRAQESSLRQASFFRLEDPKIGTMRRAGRWRSVLSQYMRSRAFATGRGSVPAVGAQWPVGATFAQVQSTASALHSPDLAAVDDLLTRWLRAAVLGGRAWGSGFYGWPMVQGLAAMSLNAACALWLSRAHAAANGRSVPVFADVEAAVGRVDRASGRAPWIGSRAEALRLRYLCADDGLRRVLAIGT